MEERARLVCAAEERFLSFRRRHKRPPFSSPALAPVCRLSILSPETTEAKLLNCHGQAFYGFHE